MFFEALPLQGAYLIKLDQKHDNRGYFARTFCKEEFEAHGLVSNFIQMSTSLNSKSGQIRGMHYQEDPYGETKVIRCIRGAVYDVIIDLRPDSKTYMQWYGVELSEDNCQMLYVPKKFAHGYKTLRDNTELFYMMDQVYVKEAAKEIEAYDKYFC